MERQKYGDLQHPARGCVKARPRWPGILFVTLLVGAILYLPVRREILDRGLIPAASFRSSSGVVLTLYDDGRYVSGNSKGTFRIEHYIEAPWISMIRLDSGQTLHVSYEARVYRVEDIPELTGADVKYKRR